MCSFLTHAEVVSETYVSGSWDRVEAQDLRLIRTASGEKLVLSIGLTDRRAGGPEDSGNDYEYRELTLPTETLPSATLAELAGQQGGLRFNPFDTRLRARRVILRRELDVRLRKHVQGSGVFSRISGVTVIVETK
jgi:hypothetical protein